MSKLTLNSSQEDIFQYLGLDENKEAYLWYKEKKNDINEIINYCSIRDLDFCLEDDFDIYFSDSFERVGLNSYYGFTVMKEKVEYRYYIEIWNKNINVAGIVQAFHTKEKALEQARNIYVDGKDYNILLFTEKRKPNGYIISLDSEVVD